MFSKTRFALAPAEWSTFGNRVETRGASRLTQHRRAPLHQRPQWPACDLRAAMSSAGVRLD